MSPVRARCKPSRRWWKCSSASMQARQGQVQAQQTLLGLTQLIHVFLSMIADLQQRCTHLERERDHARSELREADVTAIQRQLSDHKRQLTEDEARLECARREREEAEELRIVAQQKAEEHRQAWEALLRQQDHPDPRQPGTHPTGTGSAGSAPLTQLWEYDRVLEEADAQLDAHRGRMTAVREQIGIAPPATPEGPQTIADEVVRTPSADTATTADKPVTSTNDSADSAGRTSPAAGRCRGRRERRRDGSWPPPWRPAARPGTGRHRRGTAHALHAPSVGARCVIRRRAHLSVRALLALATAHGCQDPRASG